MNQKFHGVYPALLTPFDKNGDVNYKALKELVRFNLEKGVSGFYVCGSTGEAFLLSQDERKNIAETVVEEVNGRAAVIVHVGQIGEKFALDLARHAKAAGADAVSSVPPFYYGFSFEEIKSYYFSLAEAGLPVIIYNFSVGGAKLTTENVKEFLRDKRFVGVKHTSSDFYMLERLKAFRENCAVFNGYDEMFLSGLIAGADGGIGSTYNFMAEKFVAVERLFRENRIEEARNLQREINNIIEVLLRVGVIPGAKVLCRHLGLDLGVCRKPFNALTEEQEKELIAVYKQNA